MPIPDGDGSVPFEVWKEGEFFQGFATFDVARVLRDRGAISHLLTDWNFALDFQLTKNYVSYH